MKKLLWILCFAGILFGCNLRSLTVDPTVRIVNGVPEISCPVCLEFYPSGSCAVKNTACDLPASK